MNGFNLHQILLVIQHSISFMGILVILSGILYSIYQYFLYFVTGRLAKPSEFRTCINFRPGIHCGGRFDWNNNDA